MGEAGGDQWSRWVMRMHRPGAEGALAAYRDGVLERAAVAPGEVLLDVGTGGGLVGLAALDLVGPSGQVIFSDVSADLLAECERRAAGSLDRCRFVQAAADDLGPIADRSVDVVTTRSVLIYVADKARAFAEFFRVLRPGGRLSIFEPINGFAARRPGPRQPFGLDLPEVADLTAKVAAVYFSGSAEDNPLVNFDERDLLRHAEAAGFTALQMDLRIEVDVPTSAFLTDWDRLVGTAPNPLAPTLGEAMAASLTPAEQARFEAAARAALAAERPSRSTIALCFLRAVRP